MHSFNGSSIFLRSKISITVPFRQAHQFLSMYCNIFLLYLIFQSLAHEIGHSNGIDHDFTKVGGKDDPRLDKSGKSCLGQGGIMDYSKENENDKSCWSTCSIQDFTEQMNKNKTCLRVIDPKKPPPSPKPAVLTPNECDLSKVYPAFNGVRNIWLNGTLE